MSDRTGDGLFTFSQKANYWNELYSHPATLFEHHMCLRRDHAAAYIRSHFDTDAALLDLGCGAGVLSEKLLEFGYRVTAADASPDMVKLSRERLKRFPEAARRHCQANCLDLPFADGEFDLVVCLGMFGYFDEVTRALQEIGRVLKPGGTLILSVRNRNTHQIFDLLQLTKHPFRPLRAVAKRIAQAIQPSRPASGLPVGDDGFRIEIYEAPARLIKGVTERGYTLVDFDGLGYGPVAIAGHKLFSENFSIRLSDFLHRCFYALGLRRVSRWFADVSFYVFIRSQQLPAEAATGPR
ncbi:class I SAM-dependent methyltransferase [Dechloromonas sp. XY25]|uniref:Class I SAM-dependent methyltransferase n=1 Tax=Dechloromonas hankyongensis TaxID=2908002 RepID=A0ABS9K1U1_9RHOO|nr:class I SAM-dependent methyltransferase [Dechloromonas hankyongensis]MCG2577136.1 class I SAM-dependent methyltransferase [Dechloromonas hankyongensis]